MALLPSRCQYDVENDESNSSSIIFAELTSEKEKSSVGSGTERQSNRLVNYTPSLVRRDDSEFESSIELQENGLAELSSRSVENQLPLRLHSDLEGNFTSTEESSEENLNLAGQTEVDFMFTHNNCIRTAIRYGLPSSSADFTPGAPPSRL